MITIRNAQIRKMTDPAIRNMLITHAQQFFVDQCRGITESELKKTIEFACRKAKSYGFTTRAQYKRYLNLMFTFGRDFDIDPELPWAAAALSSMESKDAEHRMLTLYGIARRHQFAGEGLVKKVK